MKSRQKRDADSSSSDDESKERKTKHHMKGQPETKKQKKSKKSQNAPVVQEVAQCPTDSNLFMYRLFRINFGLVQ